MHKELVRFEDCKHTNLDYQWSHGQAARCLDCGAVEDSSRPGGWNNVVGFIALHEALEKAVGSLPSNLKAALSHYKRMAELAETQRGIGYKAAIELCAKEIEVELQKKAAEQNPAPPAPARPSMLLL